MLTKILLGKHDLNFKFAFLLKKGRMAEWLGRGLQNLLHRFESGSDLFNSPHLKHYTTISDKTLLVYIFQIILYRLKFDIKKGDEIHPLFLCDNWIYWSSLRITSNLPFVMLTLWPVLPFLTIPEKVPLICSPIAPYSVTSIFIVLPEALNSSL